MESSIRTSLSGEYCLKDGDLAIVNGVALNARFLKHIHSMLFDDPPIERQFTIAHGLHDYAALVAWTQDAVAPMNDSFLWQLFQFYKFYYLATNLVDKGDPDYE